MSTKLSLVPITLNEANALVDRWHRHNVPVVGWKCGIAAAVGGKIVGVAMLGRPVARHFDDGWTLEITRLCTNGYRNAASFLYGASRRVAFALGYRRLVTYTRKDEGGASLRAAGYRIVAERAPRSWAAESLARPRVDRTDPTVRWLWEVTNEVADQVTCGPTGGPT